MTAEERFKDTIRVWWNCGEYPSPTYLNWFIHHRWNRNLNGRECKWRREVMAELGIPLKRPKAPSSDTGWVKHTNGGYQLCP